MKSGQIVKTFTSRSGRQITIRTPKIEDLDEMLLFINEISQEDTFITFSGEVVTREEEEKFLTSSLLRMEKGNSFMLLVFEGNKLAGNCGFERDLRGKKRTYHVGEVGISIRKEYREDGIGKQLLQSLLDVVRKSIDGIKLLTLNVYEPNARAISLYRSLGFQEFGRLPKGILYRGDYGDEIKMYKKI